MRLRSLVRFSLVLLAPCAALVPAARAVSDDVRYRMPPPIVAELLTAPRLPRGAPNASPDGAWLAVPDLRSLIPISTLAEPVVKLAGLEVLPEMWANRSGLKNAAAGLTFYRVADGAQVRAKLPADVQLGTVRWSNKGDRVACQAYAKGGSELWIVDAATGAARRVDGVHLQSVTGLLEWSADDKGVFASLVVEDAPAPEEASRVPAGPAVRMGAGKATPQRTSRDVLRTPDDQSRFAWTVTAQLAWVPAGVGAAPGAAGSGEAGAGVLRKLGDPVALAGCEISDDDNWMVVTRYVLPAPLGFPAGLFPRKVELLRVAPATGGGGSDAVASVPIPLADIPLNDRSAVASVAPLGMRDFAFAPDSKSLWCASWEDKPGASPQAAVRDTTLPVPGSDRILRLDAPYTGKPVEVARTEFPLDGFLFTTDGARVLTFESYEPRRLEREAWFNARSPAKRGVLVFRSSEGVYDDPGRIATRAGHHDERAWVTFDGKGFFRFGDGFRAEGQRPFLDRCAFEGGKAARLFESEATRLEAPVTLLSADGKRFLTLGQSATEPPNWFLRQAGQPTATAVSAFTNPAEALSRAPRQQFTFKRDDGVVLNAEVVLPPDWKQGSPPLPTIFWIYPNDYRSAAAASQNRTSPNRFPSQSPLNPEVLVTQGYAVVKPDLAIVGTNDQYVAELKRSAQAAVDECVRRGFTDRDRIGVGGHSYGAFSTVNCLAHTKLFRAGLASDGAYNRTLTPFTFQAETRNLWEARDTYLGMSPFLYANQIDAPLLLAHNQDDTNVGTNPIQSQRLFEALNGLGKTVELVEYPYEDHGPASRETVLDYWARALDWFDHYVKNAQAPAAATGQTP
jgi:dipeptidyl aminopeptidase/acylaminoacyl peptidase